MGFTENVKEIAKTTKETVMAALPLGADARDIRNVLKRDHQLVSGMMEALMERAEEDHEDVVELAEQLRAELLTHAKTEEKVLYEACKRHGKDLRDFGLEGDREHEIVEMLLNRLVEERPAKDGNFKATLKVLHELVEHHVREEEGDLFPMLKNEFTEQQLIRMGEHMEMLKLDLVVPPATEPLRDLH